MRWSTSLIVVALVTAGCATPDPKETPSAFREALGEELVATDTTGIIRGLVVDEAVTPVIGAKIQLVGSQRTTSTNEAGAFGFAGLEPGIYFVDAAMPGYRGAQISAQVEAGVDEPPIVRILMAKDPSSAPFVAVLSFSGFLACSTSRSALCGGWDQTLYALTGQNFTGDSFVAYQDIPRPDPWWFQSELVWESTQQLGDRLSLSPAYAKQGDYGSPFEEMRVVGLSPIYAGAGNATLEKTAAERANFDPTDWQLVVRAFSGEWCATPDVCPIGVVLEQKFDIFSHLFYNYVPPEGWRFTEAPAPEPGT